MTHTPFNGVSVGTGVVGGVGLQAASSRRTRRGKIRKIRFIGTFHFKEYTCGIIAQIQNLDSSTES
jgi:hypothetical protein